jgi:hypothetical protein
MFSGLVSGNGNSGKLQKALDKDPETGKKQKTEKTDPGRQ